MRSTIQLFKNNIESTNVELQIVLLNDYNIMKSKCKTIIAQIILIIISLILMIIH